MQCQLYKRDENHAYGDGWDGLLLYRLARQLFRHERMHFDDYRGDDCGRHVHNRERVDGGFRRGWIRNGKEHAGGNRLSNDLRREFSAKYSGDAEGHSCGH